MSENEYKSACQKFKSKFGDWIIDGVERSLGKEYQEILDQNPKLVLERMMKMIS